MNSYTFDVGGSGIKTITFDKDNNVIKKEIISYTKRVNQFQVELEHVLDLVKAYIPTDVEINLAIGFPGIIDSDNFKIISESAVTKVDVNIKKYFKEFKLINKFIIGNDAKLATIGEYFFGRNQKIKDLVHLTIGSGVGGGIILNNQLIQGTQLFAGEFSKIYVDLLSDNVEISAFHCGTGAAMYRYFLETNQKEMIDGKALFKLFDQGDEIAVRIINNWINALSKLISNINQIICPEIISIGGGISADEKFIKLLDEKLNELTKESKIIKPNINVSKMKNDACCYGLLTILNDNFKLT